MGQGESKPGKTRNADDLQHAEVSVDYLTVYSQLINMGFDEQLSLVSAQKFPNNIDEATNWIVNNDENDDIPNTDQKMEQKKENQTENTGFYSQLINIGFPEELSLTASKTFKDNFEAAINWILNNDTNNNNNHTKQTNEQHTEKKQFIFECNADVQNCKSIQHIIDALSVYQHHNTIKDNELIEYILQNKHDLLNHYHHILDSHLNEDHIKESGSNKHFEYIYDQIMKSNLQCDVTQCVVYSRNNRVREKDILGNKQKEISYFIDVLDNIHCYFMHSVDVGYRIIHQDYEIKSNKNDQQKQNNTVSIAYDAQLSKLKMYLQSKREKLQSIRGINRVSNNKFMTNVINDMDNVAEEEKKSVPLTKPINTKKKKKKNKKKKKKKKSKKKDVKYKFGERYNYWGSRYSLIQEHVHRPKYDNIKMESIKNKLFCIEMDAFDSAYYKAEIICSNSEQIEKIKCGPNKYGIQLNSQLTVQHVLSVILYTDFDSLSYHFSTSFRKLNKNEKKIHVRKRNEEFWHWSKLLIESVNAFGTKLSKSSMR